MTKTPPIPHCYKPRSAAIRMYSARLHHQATSIRGVRLDTNDNRPRLFERIHLYPMQRNN